MTGTVTGCNEPGVQLSPRIPLRRMRSGQQMCTRHDTPRIGARHAREVLDNHQRDSVELERFPSLSPSFTGWTVGP